MDFIAQPFVFFLRWLYELTGNLGWSIIILTIVIRGALTPLTLPSLKSQKRMRALQPELKRLRAKHNGDAAAFGQAQMALFKEHKINPLAGCLPTLVQIAILFVLYHVLNQFIGEGRQGLIENVYFYGLNLTVPDRTFIIPVLAAGLQLILPVMLLPGLESHDIYPEKSKSKKTSELNKKETQQQDMAEMMQKQMMFVFPVMTGIMAATFPAGLGVYWVATTAFSLVQQYLVSGWGGLTRFMPSQIRKLGLPERAAKVFRISSSASAVSPTVSRAETLEKITNHGKQGATESSVSFAEAFARMAGKGSNTGKNSASSIVENAHSSTEKRKQPARKTVRKNAPNRKKQRNKQRRK